MNIDTIYFQQHRLRHSIRRWIVFFIVSLVISGLTALGVETQMRLLSSLFPAENTVVGGWLWKVYHAVHDTNQRYPFIAYGFDWLAFAHIVIATAFIGPLQDPVKNKWVIQFGRMACGMVIPFALLASAYRGLPLWWCAIDCSFGIIGFLPLSICLRQINQLERLEKNNCLNQIIFPVKQNKTVYESAHSHA